MENNESFQNFKSLFYFDN